MFTVDEANEMIVALEPVLRRLQDAQRIMDERREGLLSHVPGNGGGRNGADVLEAMSAAGRCVGVLQEAGVVVRDPAGGLIDFPSEMNGEAMFLCWRLGEDRVAWWHPTTSGFADRRPL